MSELSECSFLGTIGLGLPNAPPNAGAGAPNADLFEVLLLILEGLGSELECDGLDPGDGRAVRS